jgi:hypothetical protein
MGKLEHNLDAYRLAASALERLRALVRRHLEAMHGPDWETAALPDDPAEFLAQRRARENSVKWNPSSSTDLLDFAGFCNLHEILNTHPRLRDGFARLVPEPQTLRLRFLELDTVLNRIAYARPVSDSDMELLLGFDERLRQLVVDLAPDNDTPAARTASPATQAQARRQAKAPEKQPAPLPESPPPAPPPAPTSPAPPPTPASPAPQPAPEAPAAKPPGERHAEARERQPRGHAPSPPTAGSKTQPVAPASAADEPLMSPKDLETALRRGDDRAVLTNLYQEITGLAEKLWGDSAAARAPMWELVSESSWYRERFSVLRLRVVSNFYDLMRAVQERRASGGSRNDLHELLKERNFAQLLMDLREFFRPYVTPPRPGQSE